MYPKIDTGVHPKVDTGVHPQVDTGVHPKHISGAAHNPKVKTGVHPKVETGVQHLCAEIVTPAMEKEAHVTETQHLSAKMDPHKLRG